MAYQMPHDRAIENLIARYAFLVDDGNFEELGKLFDDAELVLNKHAPVRGAKEISAFADSVLLRYQGSPRTRHVTTNLIIEVAEDECSATSQSYYTVFQSLPDFPLQPIATGRYTDRFKRHGGSWRFASRIVMTEYVGDMSRHTRRR